MGMRHGLAAAGLGAALVFGGATGALAQPPGYEEGPTGVATISSTIVEPGGSVTVSAPDGSFQANSAVTVWIEPGPVQIGSTTADAAGAASATVTLPADLEAGSTTIYLAGLDALGEPVAYPVAVEIEGEPVTPPPTDPDTGLPATGAQIATIAGIGGALALTGVGIAFASRRRRAEEE